MKPGGQRPLDSNPRIENREIRPQDLLIAREDRRTMFEREQNPRIQAA
jgi:hypothetical protein